jgi:hypothetical protein
MALLGAVTGGVIASRTQGRQWLREQRIDAYAAVIQEPTRMQLAVRSEWRRGGRPDWTIWNLALALIWLVGER